MERRITWLATLGCVVVAALVCGCITTNRGLGSFTMQQDGYVARAADPDDEPAATVPVELVPISSAVGSSSEPAVTSQAGTAAASQPGVTEAGANPFAPVTVQELLPAAATAAPAGPAPAQPIADVVPPVPVGQAVVGSAAAPALPTPAVTAPAVGGSPASSVGLHSALTAMSNAGPPAAPNSLGAGYPAGPPPANFYTCLIDNMVIFGGADYFKSGGDLHQQEVRDIADRLNVTILSRLPDIDPDRMGGFVGLNTAAPLTPDGQIGFQIGMRYNQVESGGQGFFTTGVFRRCNPMGGLSLNIGAAYDLLYDDFMTYHVGQIRFQIGTAFSQNSEIGAWFNVITNRDAVEQPVMTQVEEGQVSRDAIVIDVKPAPQGHAFWRYVLPNGGDVMVFTGLRGSPKGAFIFGGTASYPLNDHWGVIGGGHLSDDDETYDAYLGIALYPGGRARVPSSCGCRYMPYMPVADNTWLTTSSDPRSFRLLFLGEEHL